MPKTRSTHITRAWVGADSALSRRQKQIESLAQHARYPCEIRRPFKNHSNFNRRLIHSRARNQLLTSATTHTFILQKQDNHINTHFNTTCQSKQQYQTIQHSPQNRHRKAPPLYGRARTLHFITTPSRQTQQRRRRQKPIPPQQPKKKTDKKTQAVTRWPWPDHTPIHRAACRGCTAPAPGQGADAQMVAPPSNGAPSFPSLPRPPSPTHWSDDARERQPGAQHRHGQASEWRERNRPLTLGRPKLFRSRSPTRVDDRESINSQLPHLLLSTLIGYFNKIHIFTPQSQKADQPVVVASPCG